MEMIVSFLSFMLLFNYLDGQPQFTTCPSGPLCLSQPVTYECNSGATTIVWIVLDTNGDRVGTPVAYTQIGNNVGDPGSIDGQFNTVLTVGGSSLVSNITFTPTLSINNYIVQCGDGGTLVNCSIVIADIPAAPIPGNIIFYSDRLSFSWIPQSASPCLSHYNVNVTSIEYTISTTDTSLSLPVPSTNDTEYSISVVAVDTGGRYMDPVDERTYTPDVPKSVTDLTLNQTDLGIDISWNEPPTLMLLPIISYTLTYHDVPDTDTNITIPAPTSTYIILNATVGSVYTVGVAAVNVLGTGPTALATIMSSTTGIISTSISSPTSSTSMTMAIITPSSSNSVLVTSMSEATQPTSTPSIASIPTSSSGLSSTVYIGIGAGVALIVIGLLIILIIVGCLVWRKPCKGEKENTTTNTVIYDTPTDTVQAVPNVPVSMNTAYGTATGSRGVDRVIHTSDNVVYGTSNTGARQTDTFL